MRSWGAVGLVGARWASAHARVRDASRPRRARSRSSHPRRPRWRRPLGVRVGRAAAASPPAPACGEPGDVFVFTSPEHAVRGQPLRVIAIADHAIDARLTVSGPKARQSSACPRRSATGGRPTSGWQRVEAPALGKWTATLARSEACGGADLATRIVNARERTRARAPDSPLTALWPTRAAWSPSLREPVLRLDRGDVRGASRRAGELQPRCTRCSATRRATSSSTTPTPPRTSRAS